MQASMLFPVSEQEQDALGIRPAEFDREDGLLGAMITPSQIRIGIKRWVKNECPNPIAGNDTADVVKSTQALLKAAYAIEIAELQKAHAQEVSTLKATLSKVNATAEQKQNLSQRRLKLRSETVSKYKTALETEQKKVQAYASRFGETLRPHPLNWFQRFMGRLCRIL